MTGARAPGRGAIGWLAAGTAAGLLAGVVAYGLVSETPVSRLSAAQAASTAHVPRFAEETVPSGVRHVYDGDFEFYVGGGVAVLDCDDDRRPDIYLAGGARPARLYHNDSQGGQALRFSQVSDPATDLTAVTGAYPLDIDADGLLDLAVLRVGEDVLLRGLGECRFERANEEWNFDGGSSWSVGFSATWEASATLPTLAVGNYLQVPEAGTGQRRCDTSALYRPTDAHGYGPPTELAPGLCSLSVLFSDWNATGRHDLRLANDRHYYREGGEQLWRISEGEPPRLYTAADGWRDLSIWGMGIASRDVTGDGLPEVVLSSQADNKLQTLATGPDEPAYEDIAIRRGTTAHRPFMGDATLPSTAWHPEFADVNNDGRADLFLSKGNVQDQGGFAADDPSNLLLHNVDGTFTESAREAGIVSLGRGRGAALADFNLDGLLDLVEVNRGENVRVWRNVGSGTESDPAAMGSWIGVRLTQPGGNRDAIGSWIEVRTRSGTDRVQLTVGGGHAGGQLGWTHFGLGEEESAKVRVRWPDGETGPWLRVDANRFALLERGTDEVSTWVPPHAQSAG